jgi:4-hydroxy-2-oxoheptanedioate aldolase
MKQKISAGEPTIGVSLMIPSPQIVEMVGRLGYDWVMIDCEHGTISLETVELMVMAAEASGVVPIVRPWTNSRDAILRVMDRGAMGVQVPHVNTANDARRAVESVKFHPLGKRGMAAATRPARYGLGVEPLDYVRWVNEQTLVCVQLEEKEALHNIDQILSVEGVDVFFVGPSDLSQSMGYPGQAGIPEVQKAIDRAFAAIAAAGKAAGSAGSPAAVLEYLRKGCLYVYTHVPKLLANASAPFLRAAQDLALTGGDGGSA